MARLASRSLILSTRVTEYVPEIVAFVNALSKTATHTRCGEYLFRHKQIRLERGHAYAN